MDINEYISSGILDRYVLGQVSSQEKKEVECMSHIYPEIKTELLALQSALEQLAMKAAVVPPDHLKTAILEKIKNEPQDLVAPAQAEKQAEVIRLNPAKGNGYRLLAAASIALLIGVGVYAYLMTNKVDEVQSELAVRSGELEDMDQSYESLQNELNHQDEQLAFLKNDATRKIPLSGTEQHPGMEVTVFWNDASQQVMLQALVLPPTPQDKQYQLWAIVDDQPVGMGVFSLNGEDAGLINMLPTNKAQAFAITLEPMGGSETPTMEEMYVIGAV